MSCGWPKGGPIETDQDREIALLKSRLAKAVGALRAIVKLSEDGDVYDMCSNAECKMRDVAEKTIKELEGA